MKPYVFRSQVPVSADYKPPEGNYNQLSGGLPHSEIQGSKPITGSPWLIAGYHVLHRLLLPRHPPNALLALDLIQKKTSFFRSKASLSRSGAGSHRNILVSVLDLDDTVLPVEPAVDPPLGINDDIVVNSLYDVKGSSDWTIKRMIHALDGQIRLWWSVPGSNR